MTHFYQPELNWLFPAWQAGEIRIIRWESEQRVRWIADAPAAAPHIQPSSWPDSCFAAADTRLHAQTGSCVSCQEARCSFPCCQVEAKQLNGALGSVAASSGRAGVRDTVLDKVQSCLPDTGFLFFSCHFILIVKKKTTHAQNPPGSYLMGL